MAELASSMPQNISEATGGRFTEKTLLNNKDVKKEGQEKAYNHCFF